LLFQCCEESSEVIIIDHSVNNTAAASSTSQAPELLTRWLGGVPQQNGNRRHLYARF